MVSLQINSLEAALLSIPGIIIAVVLHELVKAMTAQKLGDGGVKGRISLNPLKHMDALGLIFIALFGFGWANPVRLSPFHYSNRKKAMLVIFAISFIFSLLLGMLFFLLGGFWYQNILTVENFQIHSHIVQALTLAGHISIGFAILNILPVFPFDGSLVLSGIAPFKAAMLARYEKIIQLIIAFMIILGVIGRVLHPFIDQIRVILWGLL